MSGLRPYQQKAVNAVYNAYNRRLYRPGVQLPTGTGKTRIMTHLAKDVLANGGRVNIVVHRDTLVPQTIRTLLAVGISPDDIGVVKANRHEIHKRCLVVSIQSLRNVERLKTLPVPELTVVDEAHVSISPTYWRMYEHIDAAPGGRGHLAGFTATWMRSDNNGLGDIWEEIVFRRSIGWAVHNGFLVKPRAIQLGGNLDLSHVRTTSAGDYNEGDLEEVVMIEDLRDAVVQGYRQLTPGHSAVLFAPTQASARFFGEALRADGWKVAEVFAGTKKNDRQWAFAGFETGAIQILVTCTALAEGWDSPRCDTALLLRPTKHLGLFIQLVGRVLRPWANKDWANILDFVGVTDDKDMNAAIDLSTTPEHEEVELELEECDECGETRVLKYVPRVQLNLCSQCLKELDLEPEAREHKAKKIDGIHEIDLLEGSTARWLQTDFGMPFLMTSDKSQSGKQQIYYVVPINGAYNAGVTDKGFKQGRWLVQGVSAPEAMEIASEAALDDDPTVTHRNASWRKGSATDAQLRYALSLGINTEGMNKAAIADAINIVIASKVLGSVYRKMYMDMRELVNA